MIELSLSLLLMLFAVAIVASYIDTLAGGGGLITIPALMLAGVPPLMALGTNKLQSSFGVLTASTLLYKRGLFKFREVRPLIVMAFLGSVLGTIAVQFIDAKALSIVIPIVLVAITIYFLLPIKLDEIKPAKVSAKTYKNAVIPTVGVYDGMFGPATGSFFTLAGVSLKGQDLVGATIHAKTFNLATNLASLGVFIIAGQVFWLAGIVMILGQIIGAFFASKTLTNIKAIYLKRLIITVCILMLSKYAYDHFL
ncbi:TSUP family transporter [Catenovulum sp. SM1970]|uniref:TSUP family transporter n=1 Tax=Marinifaba aquimaris TaxID=2741323 RepID=UPI0015729CA8|nr:TSUP family transporter [Marinifaba aquimaris]NTS76640.1 TSUP family transporter [Marinifaba aquimaris]